MEEKNIRENSGKNKILIIILIALGLCLIGFGVYSWLSKKNDNGKIIYFNDKLEIKLKNIDDKSELYLNNKKVDTIDYNTAQVTTVGNYLVIAWQGYQARLFALGYIDENQHYYKIDSTKGLYNISTCEEKICGYQSSNYEADGKKVELVFDGENITITELEEENTSEDDRKKIDKSWYGEYKTKDKKYTLKIQDGGKIYINDNELIDVYIGDEHEKYLSFSADFDPPKGAISSLSFVLSKDKKTIEEKPGDSWKNAQSECGNFYGEYARFYARCQGFGVVSVNNNYFFTISSEAFPDAIYTTTWKKLGYVLDSNNIKNDKDGIYVCDDVEENGDFNYQCTSESKYDFKGNKISNASSNEVNNTTNANSDKITKKLVNLSCKDYNETFNNIKVDVKYNGTSETEGCMYKLLINGKGISADEKLTISSVEFYNNYVIVYSSTSGGSSIYIIDTNSTEYSTFNGVEYHKSYDLTSCESIGYNPDSYTSDEEGLLIIGTDFSGPCGLPEPKEKHAKIRVKYSNGQFGKPEVIEKYN